MAIQDLKNIAQGSSSDENSVDKLISFFEEHLPNFPTQRILNGTMSEEDLSEELHEHLTWQAMKSNQPFVFKPEKKQKKTGQKGHSKRVDFGIYYVEVNDMSIIYTLEAKKLPTGTGVREKEYVLGKRGGIERFKNEFHGIDKAGNLLDRNGIIAYIHHEDFPTWHEKINTWIEEEALWHTSEQLNKEYFNAIGKLHSTHLRISNTLVHLDHFWIKIQKD